MRKRSEKEPVLQHFYERDEQCKPRFSETFYTVSMPKFLEEKLEKEYPGNDHAVYGTLNKLGYMKGNKETKKGKYAEKKHALAKKKK